MKSTVPVAPLGDTVAVNVTGSPYCAEAVLVASMVVVGAATMVSVPFTNAVV
jgi:hypothetical protein